jgi:hypothetical protein
MQYIDKKITKNKIDDIMTPLEKDLLSYYRLMQEAVFEIFYKSVQDGATPDQAIDNIENLFEQENNSKIAKTIRYSTVQKAARKLQGRMKIKGMDISIENKKGSVRRGVDQDGHEWKIKMSYPYGYIRGTEGTDGDHVDCYIGDNHESTRVYIIHQNDPVTGKYDEDKVMIGFNTAKEAKDAYMMQYDRPGFYGSMENCDVEKFKELLNKKKGKKL